MTKQLKILNIISSIRDSHPSMVDIFEKGSCLNLFIMLRHVFPGAKAFYNSSHVVTRIGKYYYDINGITSGKNYLPITFYHDKRRTSRLFSQMLKSHYMEEELSKNRLKVVEVRIAKLQLVIEELLSTIRKGDSIESWTEKINMP